VTTAAWFIGLIFSLVLLFIVFFVVCGLMSRKGGERLCKYRDYLNNIMIIVRNFY
jgi:hypothetical protein